MTHDLIDLLLRIAGVVSVALVAVLLLRRPWRRLVDATCAYALWLLVPLLPLTLALPAPAADHALAGSVLRVVALGATPASAAPAAATAFDPVPLLLALWLSGAVLMAVRMVAAQRRYLRERVPAHGRARAARADDTAPAVVGLWRPRVLLPRDFVRRYTRTERRLILAHERVHLRRGDLVANALAAALRCLLWFHPLVHYAVRRFRDDQELACDAAVMRQFPEARRCYAGAMLKVQLAGSLQAGMPQVPVGCHWLIRHPLNERISMLKHSTRSPLRRVAGSAATLAAGVLAAFAAWAARPAVAEGKPEFVDAQLSMSIDDGKPFHPRLVQMLGVPLEVASDEAGAHWLFRYTARHAGTNLRIALGVQRDGDDLGTQQLILPPGEAGHVEVTTPDGRHRARVDMTFALRDALPVAADTASTAGADRAPQYRKLLPLPYPPEQIRDHVQGNVTVRAHVTPAGIVDQAEVARVDPPAASVLGDAAVAGVKAWTFEPARRDGRDVEQWIEVPVAYVLDAQTPWAQPAPDLDAIEVRGEPIR